MIENEIENMMQDIKVRLSYQGLNIEQYLKMINKTEEDMRNEFKEQAERAVLLYYFSILQVYQIR